MMQDIDFDELDRAVNSVTQPDAPAVSTPAPDSTVPVVTKPVRPTLSSPTIPAARRSGGRFMDVVHPSSDMRSSSPITVPVQRPMPRFEPPVETVKPVSSNDWPDPLDFHGFKTDEPQVEKPDELKVPEVIKQPVEEKEDDFIVTPLESPFLTDAKVDKRPLGAFSSTETTPAPELSDAAKDFAASIAEPETPLLEESDEELLTVETETREEPIAAPQPMAEPISNPEPISAPVVAEEEPVGPTSITQQYKEQPSTTDQPSGAIFDTEAYHQPLAHTVSKKSSALVIVWIAALILVGGGAGAAVYFFVLPLL